MPYAEDLRLTADITIDFATTKTYYHGRGSHSQFSEKITAISVY